MDLPATTMTNNLLARHLCGGVVMHDACCDVCRSMLLPTKRIVPILLGAPLLRASDGGMHTLQASYRSVWLHLGGSICALPGAWLCACVVSDT